MGKKSSDWYIPPDWAFQFGLMVVIPAIAILAGILLPVLERLKTANILSLCWSGVGLGCSGSILLFFARLPLYRQHRFWTFGPAKLSNFPRKLYRLSYIAVISGVLLLGLVWLRVK